MRDIFRCLMLRAKYHPFMGLFSRNTKSVAIEQLNLINIKLRQVSRRSLLKITLQQGHNKFPFCITSLKTQEHDKHRGECGSSVQRCYEA